MYGADERADPGYTKDSLGIVHLRGLVKGTPVPGMAVASLPDGFRPGYNTEEVMPCGGPSPCTVVFKPTGEVIFELINPSSSWLSFDGLTFSVGPGARAERRQARRDGLGRRRRHREPARAGQQVRQRGAVRRRRRLGF